MVLDHASLFAVAPDSIGCDSQVLAVQLTAEAQEVQRVLVHQQLGVLGDVLLGELHQPRSHLVLAVRVSLNRNDVGRARVVDLPGQITPLVSVHVDLLAECVLVDVLHVEALEFIHLVHLFAPDVPLVLAHFASLLHHQTPLFDVFFGENAPHGYPSLVNAFDLNLIELTFV